MSIRHTVLITAAAVMFAAMVLCAELSTGRVCIDPLPTGGFWGDSDYIGATSGSKFLIRIDDRAPITVTTNASGVFTNLTLATKHSVRIQLDGKPLASFKFTFCERGGEHLRLWYYETHGTWQLDPVTKHSPCRCQKMKQP